MAIEEARKIRETVSARETASAASDAWAGVAPNPEAGAAPVRPPIPDPGQPPAGAASDSDLGRGATDGTTLDG